MAVATRTYVHSIAKAMGAFAGAVADRHLTLDTRACDVWQWWDCDPWDPRSRVTLRTLMSLTSGFSQERGHVCDHHVNDRCARGLYNSTHETEPGTVWHYSGVQSVLAGLLAARAADLTSQGLVDR